MHVYLTECHCMHAYTSEYVAIEMYTGAGKYACMLACIYADTGECACMYVCINSWGYIIYPHIHIKSMYACIIGWIYIYACICMDVCKWIRIYVVETGGYTCMYPNRGECACI
jgi:hypothetical protein